MGLGVQLQNSELVTIESIGLDVSLKECANPLGRCGPGVYVERMPQSSLDEMANLRI
jgi:hypothetical protein